MVGVSLLYVVVCLGVLVSMMIIWLSLLCVVGCMSVLFIYWCRVVLVLLKWLISSISGVLCYECRLLMKVFIIRFCVSWFCSLVGVVFVM